ncbi:MAG: acyl-CoA desaturase [Verrucomicrobiota bacterium]
MNTNLPRVIARDPKTNPRQGEIRWNPAKSLWIFGMTAAALIGCPFSIRPDTMIVAFLLTVLTLCVGHSVGMHRLLIHQSFRTPLWVERILVHLGVLVGMGGPFGMMRLHDLRDWAQRHPHCHPFFIHRAPWWKDAWWNLHCDLELRHPPELHPQRKAIEDPYYQFLEKTWRWQQLPLALLLGLFGGWPWILWGICLRIPLSLTGHWLIGHLAHPRQNDRAGLQPWLLKGHAVQGANVAGLGLLTMGEAWHNNHHAFPESARLGLEHTQRDPGWWVICLLQKLGLADHIQLPETLPPRPERTRNKPAPEQKEHP